MNDPLLKEGWINHHAFWCSWLSHQYAIIETILGLFMPQVVFFQKKNRFKVMNETIKINKLKLGGYMIITKPSRFSFSTVLTSWIPSTLFETLPFSAQFSPFSPLHKTWLPVTNSKLPLLFPLDMSWLSTKPAKLKETVELCNHILYITTKRVKLPYSHH